VKNMVSGSPVVNGLYADGAFTFTTETVFSDGTTTAPPSAPMAGIATLNIGFLHPVYRETLAYDAGGHLRLVGSLMAIEAINADPDILPDTVVKFEFLDSKRSSGVALQGAMDHATSSFGNDGAHAVVGPASSGPSMNAQLVLKNFGIPQISYVATHMLLPRPPRPPRPPRRQHLEHDHARRARRTTSAHARGRVEQLHGAPLVVLDRSRQNAGGAPLSRVLHARRLEQQRRLPHHVRQRLRVRQRVRPTCCSPALPC
jgi:hypothetical protein